MQLDKVQQHLEQVAYRQNCQGIVWVASKVLLYLVSVFNFFLHDRLNQAMFYINSWNSLRSNVATAKIGCKRIILKIRIRGFTNFLLICLCLHTCICNRHSNFCVSAGPSGAAGTAHWSCWWTVAWLGGHHEWKKEWINTLMNEWTMTELVRHCLSPALRLFSRWQWAEC